jgi:hypothetical protein
VGQVASATSHRAAASNLGWRAWKNPTGELASTSVHGGPTLKSLTSRGFIIPFGKIASRLPGSSSRLDRV